MSDPPHSALRQRTSLTMWIGAPDARIRTAFSIFRPKVECIHDSVAHSPITRKSVCFVRDPASAPRSTAAASHSRRDPMTNVPVNVKRLFSKLINGVGEHNGSDVLLSTSPSSKSLRQRSCRKSTKLDRSSSSTIPSRSTSSILSARLDSTGLSITPADAATHFCRNSISLSFKCPSARTPLEIPTSSVTCLSSNLARECPSNNSDILNCSSIPDLALGALLR